MTLFDPTEITCQLENELLDILNYWKKNTIDREFDGFVGRIDHNNNVIEKANKGIILNTRILWTFSRANNFYGDQRFDEECTRAFDYIYEHFKDKNFGGVYWEVDYTGQPSNKRKQSYAQAFCIYALSEFYKYSKNARALTWAIELYHLLEDKAYDVSDVGYIEAFNEHWEPIEDLRLSEKDLNAPKTTNTHLHIMEAYTTLYEVTMDSDVERSLKHLLHLFLDRIFDKTNHLKLFFTKDWEVLSSEISYGHDIEAVWLMNYAAKILKDSVLLNKSAQMLVKVSKAFIAEGIDTDFGVFNSYDPKLRKMDKDKHWWPQAEAMIGLQYACKITKEEAYFDLSCQVWGFIKDYIIDAKNGEWFFRTDVKGKPYTTENKVGPWKCPYHNSRALIETITILKNI